MEEKKRREKKTNEIGSFESVKFEVETFANIAFLSC